jgi:hypothetical protein
LLKTFVAKVAWDRGIVIVKRALFYLPPGTRGGNGGFRRGKNDKISLSGITTGISIGGL